MPNDVFGHGESFPGTGGINPEPVPTPYLPTGGALTDDQKLKAKAALDMFLASLQPKAKKQIAVLYEDGTWEAK